MKRSHWSWSRSLAWVSVAVAVAVVVGCSQPPAPPTSVTKEAPKDGPKAVSSKDAKPEAKESKPEKPAPKEGTKAVKMKAAYASAGALEAPLWITKEKGFFDKYGLDVDVQYIASSTTLLQAMIAGEIHVSQAGGGAMVSADLGGADLIMVAATSNSLTFSLYGQSNIQRVEDLKGKVVGASRRGSSTDFAARYTLKKYGLEPDKDVTVVQTGGVPETLAALQSGGIQAGVISPPSTLTARKLGMRELVSMPDLGVDYTSAGVTLRKQYIANNEEVVRNFMKAYVEGIAVARQDKDYAKKVIASYTKTDDQEVLEETYQFFVAKGLATTPYASLKGMQTVLDEIAAQDPKAQGMKPENFVDNRFVKELDESGFIKKLYTN